MLLDPVPFSLPSPEWANHPFPREIGAHPWVLYHGTSSCYESSIESHGLLPTLCLFRREDLFALVGLFDSLGWMGSLRSYGVLTAFSLGHDHAHEEGKPIYLADGAKRALLYASADFAGGEIARAVRASFSDLRAYLDDPAVREEQLHRHNMTLERLRQLGAVEPPPLPRYDPASLRERLEEMASVEDLAIQTLSSFDHGVVYAIQFQESDLQFLEDHPSMGTKCHATISPDRLVAKIHVPADYVYKAGTKELDYLFDLPARNGILAALRERSAQQALGRRARGVRCEDEKRR